MNLNKSIYFGLLAVAIIGAIAITSFSQDKDDAPVLQNTNIENNPTNSTVSENEPIIIKDGEYESEGNYTSPGGPESIKVKVSIKNGNVENLTVEPLTSRIVSKRYQNIFVENVNSVVISKNINEIKLDKVSGSSLTPKGLTHSKKLSSKLVYPHELGYYQN